MRRAVRVGLVVLGAAMAVYGAASLTGWWLGVPVWERWRVGPEPAVRFYSGTLPLEPIPKSVYVIGDILQIVGLALVAVGAWPRRRAGVTS